MDVPVLSLTITPDTEADQERLRAGLAALMAEDPTIRVQPGPQAGEIAIGVMGELQLEIICDRLKREFDVEATLGKPRVIHRQTLGSDGAAVTSEPIMRVEVVAPSEYVIDVVEKLSARRGEILSLEDRKGTRVVTARVPMSSMFGYASDLRERTLGRATFTSTFDRYEPVGAGPDENDDRHSYIGWPVTPRKPLNNSAIALPEPD
jgi:translation elongation factor EF-G